MRPFHRAFLALVTGVAVVAATGGTGATAAPVTAHAAVTPQSAVSPQSAGTPLGSGTSLYPRVIRLAHSGAANGQLIASTVAFDGGGNGKIYRSTDNGASFSPVGEVRDPASAGGLCCTSLYEIPTAVGDLPAGALVWAGSFGQDARPMSIDLWASLDHGATWSKRSTVLTSPNNGGLWEPEMRVNAEGQLTLYYSDETDQPAHSQKLMEVFSPDGGRTWSHPYPVVSLANSGARPGMAVVRELKNGTRIMTYEICGPGYNCDVYYRTSADGADWADPALAGTRIVSSGGGFFRHAPTTTVVDDGSATGKIVLVGQMYWNSGVLVAANGITLLTNSSGGAGAWGRAVAPVTVPEAYDNYCPNYSSALAPTADNSGVVEIASKYVGSDCRSFFASGRL